jgi:hypothetical protein
VVDFRRAGQVGGWAAAVVGLWILITTVFWFLLGSRSVGWFFWSTVISGIAVLVLSATAGFSSGRIARRTGGVAAIIGLWVLVTTVVWFLVGGDRVGWFFWSTFIAGIAVLVLSAFAGVTR